MKGHYYWSEKARGPEVGFIARYAPRRICMIGFQVKEYFVMISDGTLDDPEKKRDPREGFEAYKWDDLVYLGYGSVYQIDDWQPYEISFLDKIWSMIITWYWKVVICLTKE